MLTSNVPALKQHKSVTGTRVVSIIASDGLFRFVEEREEYQPETETIDGYSHWAETYRSGLFESVEAAEAEAVMALPWLKAALSQ